MMQDDAVFAILRRLEADNRMMKRVGAAALTVAALVVLISAVGMQGQEKDKKPNHVPVQDVLRTRRLELTNADGEVVAVLQTNEREEAPGWLTNYHDNGRPKWRAQIANNRYEGSYTAWWPNGLKSEEGTFVKGRKHGLFTTYWENGQPKARGAYSDGLKAGIWTEFHDNGAKSQEGLYEDDHKVGLWKGSHTSGEPASIRTFVDGKANGDFREWYTNGALFAEGRLEEDKLTGECKFYRVDGSTDEKRSGTYKNGKLAK